MLAVFLSFYLNSHAFGGINTVPMSMHPLYLLRPNMIALYEYHAKRRKKVKKGERR